MLTLLCSQPLCCEGSRHSTPPASTFLPCWEKWDPLAQLVLVLVHPPAAAALLEGLHPKLRVGLAKALASYGNGMFCPEYSFTVCVFFTS